MPIGLVSLLPMIVLLAAAPFVLALPRGRPRALAGAGLAALFLAHAGLYLLYASRLACWILVGAGAVAAASVAFPKKRAPAFVAASAALALGLAFQLTPGRTGVILYVAAAAPLLLGTTLALLASAAIRRDASARTLAAGAALALFAGLIPLTSFYPTFLLTFEPMHLGFLALAMVALAILAASRTPRPETWGDIAARPGVSLALTRAALIAGALFATTGADSWLARGALALTVAAAIGAPARRLTLTAGAGLAIASAAAGEAALDTHLRAAPAIWQLAAASIGASLYAFSLALAIARWRDDAERDAALDAPAIPHGATLRDGEPTVAAVRTLAASLRPGEVGILRVRAPSNSPFWTLPRETYDALMDSGVHALILEGDDASLVPPVEVAR